MPIEAVVFDIGNVLIGWNPERFYDAQIGEARRKAMFAAIDLHAANDVIDSGGPFKSTFYDLADQHPEWGDEIRMWHDRWIEMAAPAIDHSVRLLRALRANDVPVYALSNFGVETFAYAQTHYDFLNEFDRPYISGHMRVIKQIPQSIRWSKMTVDWQPGRFCLRMIAPTTSPLPQNVDGKRICLQTPKVGRIVWSQKISFHRRPPNDACNLV